MSDFIERQAAIDALAKHEKSKGHNYTLFVDIVSECAEIIRDLPSAQSTQNNTSNALKSLDCIDRQAAIDMFQNLAYDDWNQGAETTWANAYSEAAEMVENLPSAHPAQKKGKWRHYEGYLTCSECGASSADGGNYCPNCGAKMDEEEENATD